jgi:hypothetical protein
MSNYKRAARITAQTFAAVLAGTISASAAGVQKPANCEADLNQCSLHVSDPSWHRNAFPHKGSEKRIKFTTGEILDCISNGRGVPRLCHMSHGPK